MLLTSIIVDNNHSGMNLGDIIILKPTPCHESYHPHVRNGTFFIAVMSGEMNLLAGGGTRRLPACSLLWAPAAMVVRLEVGDDAVGICWTVYDGGVPPVMELNPQPMDELTAMVLQEAAFEAPPRPDMLEAALVYLSRRLLAVNSPFKPELPASADGNELAGRARRFMAANLDAPLTLAELTGRLDCSPSALMRAFKISGLPSPMQCFAELRVSHAKESLRQSELSISNIAASLGFRDLATFSHFFSKHTGQSPRDYRRNCRWLL